MFSNFVLGDYQNRLHSVPYFFKRKLISSNRTLGSNLVHGDVFGNKVSISHTFFWAAFAPIFLRQKNSNLKRCTQNFWNEKAASKILVKLSQHLTRRFFCTKVLQANFCTCNLRWVMTRILNMSFLYANLKSQHENSNVLKQYLKTFIKN